MMALQHRLMWQKRCLVSAKLGPSHRLPPGWGTRFRVWTPWEPDLLLLLLVRVLLLLRQAGKACYCCCCY
jgi:hypothetical protein